MRIKDDENGAEEVGIKAGKFKHGIAVKQSTPANSPTQASQTLLLTHLPAAQLLQLTAKKKKNEKNAVTTHRYQENN